MFLYLVPYPYWETTATLWQIFRLRYSEKIVTSFCSSCCTCCALICLTCQHESTRINTSLTRVNTSLTRVNRVRHRSARINTSLTRVQHESTQIYTIPRRVNMIPIRINTNESKSNAGLDHEKEKSMIKRKNKM